MHKAAHSKMLKARMELVLDHPFFANLALRLEFREDHTCRTAWADGQTLGYNPIYIDALPLEKVKGLQCHEVLHLACCHHTRRGLRDIKLWNTACDYAINPVLLEAGIVLPTGYLDDPKHHGKSAEAIYSSLKNHNEELKGGADGGAEQGAITGDDIEGGGDGDAQSESEGEKSAQGSDGEAPEETGDGAGAGDDGDEERKQSDDSNDPGMTGEVRDAPSNGGGTDSDSKQVQEDAWRSALTQAIHKSLQFGDLPGNMERLFNDIMSPTLNWQELLRQFMADAAKNDFSWVRPNRRYLHSGLYLPGMHSEELPEVAIAVDVSGSITQRELDAFAAELSDILEEFDTTITAITCDTKISEEIRLSKWDLPLELAATGGGGTDFRPPFVRLEEKGIVPACLIYLTDMQCNLFPEDPGYPVLWVSTTPQYNTPPFGEVLVLE